MVENVQRRQLIATLILAALAVLAVVSVLWALEQTRHDATSVNQSGRQRMYSQEISSQASRLVQAAPGPEQRQLRQAIQRSVDQMRRMADQLAAQATGEGHRVYHEAPHRAHARTMEFLDHAQALADAVDQHAAPATLIRLRDTVHRSADALLPVLHTVVTTDEATATQKVQTARSVVLMMGSLMLAALLAIWTIVLRPATLVLQQEHTQAQLAEQARRREVEREAFGISLQRAFEMADSEPAMLQSVERAFGLLEPRLPLEVLLADSSQAHLRTAVEHPTMGAPGCSVPGPNACPAVRRGRTLMFPSSGALDACPHLVADAADTSCGALCVPVAFMGRPIGVIHAQLGDGEPPPPILVERLEQIGVATASRMSTIRTFEQIQLQATTDPLTGLLNRRALEEGVRTMVMEGRSFAVAIADLDHFKRLNDTHGHDAGDRALCTFAKACIDSVRDDDLVARFGGEEFVIVLADVSAERAFDVLERLRGHLAEVVSGGDTPTFTASYGVSDSRLGTNLDMLIQVADAALLRAKESGRDRVLVADMGGTEPIVRIDAA